MTSLPDETTKQRVSLEKPPGVFLFKGEQLTSGLTDVGKDQLHSPHLTLVPQTEFTDQLQLLVQASLLERTPGGREDLGAVLGDPTVNHDSSGNRYRKTKF